MCCVRHKVTGARQLCCCTLFAFTTLIINTASACTVCDSETGQLVRGEIFGDEFWTTLVGVVAPFPVLVALITMYNCGVPNFRARASDRRAPLSAPNADP
jgi:hypothetical protein